MIGIRLAEECTAPMLAKTWLVLRSGPLAGTRYLLQEGVLRIGRAPDNDIVAQGQQSATVSLYHLEISGDGGRYRVRDVGSTNGTYIDGEQISDADLQPTSVIRLGSHGQEYAVPTEQTEASDMRPTLLITPGIQLPTLPLEPA